MIDGLELQTAQQELIDSQKALVGIKINYLKALVNLDNLIGMSLKTWGLQVVFF